MSFRRILLALMAALVLAVSAGAQSSNVLDRRDAVIATCEGDGENAGVCACAFDEWAGGLEDASSSSAQAFAALMTLPEGEQPKRQMVAAAISHMSNYSEALLECADMDVAALERQYEAVESAPSTSARTSEAQDRAAGEKAAEQPTEETVTMNGVDVSPEEKRIAWREREFARLEKRGVRNTPVSAYEAPHKAYCMANRNDTGVCACTWEALVSVLGTRDDVPARIAAYMSSVPPGDIAGVSAAERQAGGELFGQYLAAKDCD